MELIVITEKNQIKGGLNHYHNFKEEPPAPPTTPPRPSSNKGSFETQAYLRPNFGIAFEVSYRF